MQPGYFKYIFLSLLLSASLVGCGQQSTKTNLTDPSAKTWDKTIPGSFSGQSKLIFDSLAIARFFKIYPDVKEYRVPV
ncbi:hypothetical protein [Mucilaginibacter antarcticus]|uniref:hypothetical protein n=1 Tax=Mucilaginibacter antarcticus TaxID=1855725 RepID=UPI00362BE555